MIRHGESACAHRDLFERAWQLALRQPDAALALVDTLGALGDAESLEEAWAALIRLQVHARSEHDPRSALDAATPLRQRFERLGEPACVLRATVLEANALADLEDRDAAIALIRGALPQARRSGQAGDLARLLNSLGAILCEEGAYVEATQAWFEALEILSPAGPSPELALVMQNVGALYVRFGNHLAADAFLRDSLHMIELLSLDGLTKLAAGNLGYNLLQLERAAEASAFLEALAPALRATLDLKEFAFFQIVRAEALSATGQLAQARDWLEAVDRLGRRAMDLQNSLYHRIAWLRLLRREGRLDEALAWLRAAEAAPAHIDDPVYELQVLLEAAELMHALGHDREAFRYARQHHLYAREVQKTAVRAEYLSLQTRHEVRAATLDRDFQARRRAEVEAARAQVQALNQALAERLAQIEALEAALREQALRDPLTGLYNRRFVSEVLAGELARCQRAQQPVAFAMVDADHFKALNDRHGHAAGDRVLIALAGMLADAVGAHGMAARVGGEEFFVVLPGADAPALVALLEAVLVRLRETPFACAGGAFEGCSFSAGVVACMPHAAGVVGIDAALRAADRALYRAKAYGRGRVVQDHADWTTLS